MKYILKFKNYIVLAIIAFVLILTLNTCKKSTDCIGIVLVKYQSDTNKIAPNVKVTFNKGSVHDEGVTDAQGEFKSTFKLEAILDVVAVQDSDIVTKTPKLYAAGVIKLKPGATVRKTLFLK